jgi:hypothetical protein
MGALIAKVVALLLIGLVLTGMVFALIDACHWQRRKWRVKYPAEKLPRRDFKGGFSILMSYWHASDYASIFDGEVVKLTKAQEQELKDTGKVADMPFTMRGSL